MSRNDGDNKKAELCEQENYLCPSIVASFKTGILKTFFIMSRVVKLITNNSERDRGKTRLI